MGNEGDQGRKYIEDIPQEDHQTFSDPSVPFVFKYPKDWTTEVVGLGYSEVDNIKVIVQPSKYRSDSLSWAENTNGRVELHYVTLESQQEREERLSPDSVSFDNTPVHKVYRVFENNSESCFYIYDDSYLYLYNDHNEVLKVRKKIGPTDMFESWFVTKAGDSTFAAEQKLILESLEFTQ